MSRKSTHAAIGLDQLRCYLCHCLPPLLFVPGNVGTNRRTPSTIFLCAPIALLISSGGSCCARSCATCSHSTRSLSLVFFHVAFHPTPLIPACSLIRFRNSFLSLSSSSSATSLVFLAARRATMSSSSSGQDSIMSSLWEAHLRARNFPALSDPSISGGFLART